MRNLTLVFIFLFAQKSFAQSPLPTLNPNCTRVVFFSSGQIRSDMRVLYNIPPRVANQVTLRSARETASELCRALANVSSFKNRFLPNTFKAILSLDSSRAIHSSDAGKPVRAKNYISIDGPVCNMNGEIIANNAAEFWSSNHRAKMDIDEKGVSHGNHNVWTGSNALGVYDAGSCGGRPTCNCYNWTSTTNTGHGGNRGRPCAKDGRWAVGAWRQEVFDADGCELSVPSGGHASPCGDYSFLYCIGTANYVSKRLPEKHGN